MARPKGEIPFDKPAWEKENRVSFTFKLNRNKDMELINYLKSKQNTATYIIDLLRNDMANGSK